MKAATAEAMQWRALGSMLLVRQPALASFTAAYPSWMVYCPEPMMATPVGPSARCVRLNSASITSKASVQVTGTKSPFLSNLPFFLRSSGRVRRSSP